MWHTDRTVVHCSSGQCIAFGVQPHQHLPALRPYPVLCSTAPKQSVPVQYCTAVYCTVLYCTVVSPPKPSHCFWVLDTKVLFYTGSREGLTRILPRGQGTVLQPGILNPRGGHFRHTPTKQPLPSPSPPTHPHPHQAAPSQGLAPGQPDQAPIPGSGALAGRPVAASPTPEPPSNSVPSLGPRNPLASCSAGKETWVRCSAAAGWRTAVPQLLPLWCREGRACPPAP